MSWLHRCALRAVPWQVKRQQRLEIDGYRCRTCGHDGTTYPLQIHHVSYERFGNEDVEHDLITLCAACHRAIEDSKNRQGRGVRWALVSTEFEEIAGEVY